MVLALSIVIFGSTLTLILAALTPNTIKFEVMLRNRNRRELSIYQKGIVNYRVAIDFFLFTIILSRNIRNIYHSITRAK